NAGEMGFYRQNLDGELRGRLLANLGKLSPAEQMGCLGDQWALVRGEMLGMSQFLDVLSSMSEIDHYGVVEKAVSHMRTIERLLEDAENEKALASFLAWEERSFGPELAELDLDPRQGETRND